MALFLVLVLSFPVFAFCLPFSFLSPLCFLLFLFLFFLFLFWFPFLLCSFCFLFVCLSLMLAVQCFTPVGRAIYELPYNGMWAIDDTVSKASEELWFTSTSPVLALQNSLFSTKVFFSRSLGWRESEAFTY